MTNESENFCSMRKKFLSIFWIKKSEEELLCKLFYIKVVNQNNLCHPYYHGAFPQFSHCLKENLWRCCEKEILIIIFSAQLSLCILSFRRCFLQPLLFQQTIVKVQRLNTVLLELCFTRVLKLFFITIFNFILFQFLG